MPRGNAPQGYSRHALVIGGSGMLAGVCLSLARDGWGVSVLARHPGPIDALRERLRNERIGSPGSIHLALADYRDDRALAAALATALKDRGPVRLAVAWIHSTAPRAPSVVARAIGAAAIGHAIGNVPLYQVLGSVTGDARYLPIDPAAAAAPGTLHRRIALGWVPGAGGSRWLTDQEISAGVLDAIRTGAPMTEIGTCSPRSDQPGN